MIQNTASTSVDIDKNISERWSPRAFRLERLDPISVKRLFEAARWSASSYNEQPWRFIAGMQGQGKTFEKIIDVLVPFNQKWASKAPLLILACAKKTFSKNGKHNHHALYDVGQAMATLTLQATEEGLYVHQMAGFSEHKAIENFNIPDDYEPIVVAAVGKIDEQEIYDNDGPKERKRMELNEICWSDWDTAFDLK